MMQLIFCSAVAQLLLAAVSSASALLEPFDSREASIDSVHNAFFTRLITCRGVVSSFIARIEAFNPTINAIITLNPNALSLADQMDMQILARNPTGSLFCIPVLLKDNYDTTKMNTTEGCLDLAGSQPKVDVPATAVLKNAGAIILGKTNLHELALCIASWRADNNHYDHTRTPGGSSGGTGAAIATSFAVFGTGTDASSYLY
jgi:Asp-tRNA(Asn)/Glu-tRNA(Gln) amidotransferase A subunit family amidase